MEALAYVDLFAQFTVTDSFPDDIHEVDMLSFYGECIWCLYGSWISSDYVHFDYWGYSWFGGIIRLAKLTFLMKF